ncbi:MAG: hypothetical protein ABGX87_16245 [Alcanivorax sp.]|uniref:hypothetical protein n=1 Tax=Alloalcanivorax marinus TaxID=1177169 RepID=UPI001956FD2C|nr:hypothetical protein [Alloalcanivorax marinus]MBM7333518.1 hypothetical protein [Alloalcanivorax marinus]
MIGFTFLSKRFDSSNPDDVDAIADPYGVFADDVRAFIDEARRHGEVDKLSHQEVHRLIASELALPVPDAGVTL